MRPKETVGTPLWYDLLAPLVQSWCVIRGGHRHDTPEAPANCSRCGWWGGSRYDPTLRSVWKGFGVRSLYWCQVNRYRDWIGPWARRWSRIAALFRIWSCPKCEQVTAVMERGDCEVCYHTWFMDTYTAPAMREYLKRRKRKADA